MRQTMDVRLMVARPLTTTWLLWALLAGCSRPSPVDTPAPRVEAGTAGASVAEAPPAGAPAEVRSAEEETPAAQQARPGAIAKTAIEFKDPAREVALAMLELAGVAKGELVYLLGCGDGGIAIAAALDRGARVVAIDPSAEAIASARERARKAGAEKLVEFRKEDVAEAKFGDAQVVLILLPPAAIKKIERRLPAELMPGTRVVSWVPVRTALPGQGEEPDEDSGALSLFKVPGRSHPSSLAPFVRTPMPVVHEMLDIAGVTKDDLVYDLGCGDGRIVIEAAKRHGARAVGIDFDMRRIEEARENARREGVEKLVEFRHQDFLQADFSDATVVTLFLLPQSNVRLKEKLAALKPGTRIVSHNFDTKGWPPTREEALTLPDGTRHKVYLWEVRENMGGEQEAAKPE
jgi:ubiquinone/menaquinone biosynthesis C-methylase UbiE